MFSVKSPACASDNLNQFVLLIIECYLAVNGARNYLLGPLYLSFDVAFGPSHCFV